MTRFVRFLVVALVLLGLGGCHKSTTAVPYAWRDGSFEDARFTRLFVVGDEENERVRRLFEESLVEAVSSRGATAEASWGRFPDRQPPTDAQIREAGAAGEFDGVLITRLLSIDERVQYVRPPTYSSPPSSYGLNTSGYYATSYTRIPGAGHYETATMYRIETNLYSWPTGDLVWSVQSDTLELESLDDTIASMTSAVAAQLRREKLIR